MHRRRTLGKMDRLKSMDIRTIEATAKATGPLSVPSLITPQEAAALATKAENVLRNIHQRYFTTQSYESFIEHHTGHTSMVMKLAAYQFASSEVIKQLTKSLDAQDYLLHPVFYMRVVYPGVSHSEGHRRAQFDSQPHYDRTFGLDATTLWVALVDVDTETGGLCWFQGEDVTALFPRQGANRYGLTGYYDQAHEIDPVLAKGVGFRSVCAGHAIAFDSSILHGATKPKSKKRISFDFRLISKEAVMKGDARAQQIFEAVAKDLDGCNERNGVMLTSDPKFLEPNATLRWQAEYGWIA